MEDTNEIVPVGDFLYFDFTNKAILLNREITYEYSDQILDKLLFYNQIDERPIKLFINSPGGEMFPGLQIVETITQLDVPVIGIVNGCAGSMAFYITQACDMRLMTPLSFLFWHEILKWGIDVDSKNKLMKEAAAYHLFSQNLEKFFTTRAKMSKTNWKKYFQTDNDIYFTAEEALRLNLVDEVLTPKKTQGKAQQKIRQFIQEEIPIPIISKKPKGISSVETTVFNSNSKSLYR